MVLKYLIELYFTKYFKILSGSKGYIASIYIYYNYIGPSSKSKINIIE